MTLDRCGSKGNHDVTGGEAVRMPIKLWEPVEKSSCIPEGGDIRSPMKQNATGGATGDEHMARWSRYDRSAKEVKARWWTGPSSSLKAFQLRPLCPGEIIGESWTISQNQPTRHRRSHRRPRPTTDEGSLQPSPRFQLGERRRATRCDLWWARCLPLRTHAHLQLGQHSTAKT
jgi:hypothetical protein